MITILRPLSTSELLDRTFHLYRNNFLVFVGIAAIPQLVVFAMQLGFRGYLDPSHVAVFFLTSFVLGVTSFTAIEIAHAAVVMAVSNLHLGRRATISSAYSAAKASLLRAVLIGFAVLLIPILIAIPFIILVAVAMPFLIGMVRTTGFNNVAVIRIVSAFIPLGLLLVGLRWWLAWSLVVPVTVLEGGGMHSSMRRSKALTKGCRGRIFVVYLLIGILGWVVSSAIQLPLVAVFGWRSLRDPSNVSTAIRAVSSVGGFVSASLVGALGEIAITLIYYDRRVRKEGFDLQLMMSGLQPNPQAAAATSIP